VYPAGVHTVLTLNLGSATEKIEIIERLGEVAAFFAERRIARRRSRTASTD